MNANDALPNETVDEDYAPELEMTAAGDDLELEAPNDPPVVPGGRDNARLPGAPRDGDEDEDDSYETRHGPPTDSEITARVVRLLRSDAATSMLRIHVATESGVVTLTGEVQTLDDTDNAAEVASRVPGVVDVVEELDVDL
jgi:hypothetical protein